MNLDKKFSTIQGVKDQLEADKEVYKALSTLMFKSVFSENLPKKFIDHYAYGSGKEYKLNMNETISLNVEKTGIKGLAQDDVDKFNRLIANVHRVGRKQTILHFDNYKIQGASNVGGTLGRFSIEIEGKLILDSKDNSKWTFEGKMRYADTYDFKTKSVTDKDLNRSWWGDFQTGVGNILLPGTAFKVTSDWIDVKQSSSEKYFDFFNGKSTEDKQNRVSNEIYTATENGKELKVGGKEIKEVTSE